MVEGSRSITSPSCHDQTLAPTRSGQRFALTTKIDALIVGRSPLEGTSLAGLGKIPHAIGIYIRGEHEGSNNLKGLSFVFLVEDPTFSVVNSYSYM